MIGLLESAVAHRSAVGVLVTIGWAVVGRRGFSQAFDYQKRYRNDKLHNAAPVAPEASGNQLQGGHSHQKGDHCAQDRLHANIDASPIRAKDGPLKNIDDFSAISTAHYLQTLPLNRGPRRALI